MLTATLAPEQESIRAAVAKVCAAFDLDYWLKKDRAGGFPHELHAALARDGWLGIAMSTTSNEGGVKVFDLQTSVIRWPIARAVRKSR